MNGGLIRRFARGSDLQSEVQSSRLVVRLSNNQPNITRTYDTLNQTSTGQEIQIFEKQFFPIRKIVRLLTVLWVILGRPDTPFC